MKRLDHMEIGRHRLILIGLAGLFCLVGPGWSLAQEQEEIFSPYLAAKRMPEREESILSALRGADATQPARFAETVRSGVLLVKHGRYDEAIELLEPHRGMEQFTLLHALGVAYLRSNRNQEAYDVLMQAHRLRPDAAGPLLPAALACVRMPRTCYAYRDLARQYKEQGGRFVRLADKIRYHVPYMLRKS